MNMEGALSDLRIVEYANFISGPYCAKLLADLRAEVIKVEPPGTGDEARRRGPFPGDVPHIERSGLFLYVNTNKLGVTLDLKSKTGVRLFKQLIEQADILVENNAPSLMEDLGLDYETLSGINPGLIMISITPFGQTGCYRDYKGCDLIGFHTGGLGYATPDWVENREEEPPLKAGGQQAYFMAGATAAVAALGAVFVRHNSGLGQHVDVSEQEAVAKALSRNIANYAYGLEEEIADRRREAPFTELPVSCKDGYVDFHCVEDYHWQAMKEAMGNPEWCNSDLFSNYQGRCQNWKRFETLISKWTRNLTRDEVCRLMQAKGVAFIPIRTIDEVINDEHLAERHVFVEIDHPEAGKLKYPGAPCNFQQPFWEVRRPAPLLGQHNEEVFCQRLGCTRGELVRLGQAGVI